MRASDKKSAETGAETERPKKDPMTSADAATTLQSLELKLKTLEMQSMQDESFMRRHAPFLSMIGFLLVVFFAWYQQTQAHAMQLSLLEARTSTLVRSTTGNEGKSLAVQIRLTRLGTQLTDFVGSQRETNREMKQMVTTLLIRSAADSD